MREGYVYKTSEEERLRCRIKAQARKEAQNETTQMWKENHPGLVKEYTKDWSSRNKDKVAATRRRYYDANKEKIAEYSKEYYRAKVLNNK